MRSTEVGLIKTDEPLSGETSEVRPFSGVAVGGAGGSVTVSGGAGVPRMVWELAGQGGTPFPRVLDDSLPVSAGASSENHSDMTVPVRRGFYEGLLALLGWRGEGAPTQILSADTLHGLVESSRPTEEEIATRRINPDLSEYLRSQAHRDATIVGVSPDLASEQELAKVEELTQDDIVEELTKGDIIPDEDTLVLPAAARRVAHVEGLTTYMPSALDIVGTLDRAERVWTLTTVPYRTPWFLGLKEAVKEIRANPEAFDPSFRRLAESALAAADPLQVNSIFALKAEVRQLTAEMADPNLSDTSRRVLEMSLADSHAMLESRIATVDRWEAYFRDRSEMMNTIDAEVTRFAVPFGQDLVRYNAENREGVEPPPPGTFPSRVTDMEWVNAQPGSDLADPLGSTGYGVRLKVSGDAQEFLESITATAARDPDNPNRLIITQSVTVRGEPREIRFFVEVEGR